LEALRRRPQGSSTQSASQTSVQELTMIERELQVWQQVIKGPEKNEMDIDILQFWKSQAASLPNLSWIARRIFSIPASSTSSERTFSTGGKVVSASRTLLNADKAESLIMIMKNFDELDPFVEKYVLRNSDFKKLDKKRQKAQERMAKDKSKQKGKEDEEDSHSSAAAHTDNSEAEDEYHSDDVLSIHDSDDEA